MVYRLELTYDEIVDFLVVKYIAGPTMGYKLLLVIYETTDFNLMLKSLLPNKVKMNFTLDDGRLRPNLTTNKTIRIKIFFF